MSDLCSEAVQSEVICLQGFGNVGAWAAEIFQGMGGRIQAVSDAFGAIYNKEGLDIKALRQHLKEKDTIDTFSGGSLTSLKHSL